MTQDESDRVDWQRRLDNRREKGVDRFWSQERKQLRAGGDGERNYPPEVRDQIINDETVTDSQGVPLEGHHKYNVNDYPQKAAESGNIYPATKAEHQNRWHGGNWQNDTAGEPLNPDYKEEF